MGELDEQIDRSRRLIRLMVSGGRDREAEHEEARLAGLLCARNVLGLGDDVCLHPVHKAAGSDGVGRTLWRCTNPECGAIHDGS